MRWSISEIQREMLPARMLSLFCPLGSDGSA